MFQIKMTRSLIQRSPSPRHSSFPLSLQSQNTHQSVEVSRRAPFGLRSSGLLLRPSIVAMNPSARHDHVRRVLPSIVNSITDTFVSEALQKHDNVERLRPLPQLSSRAAATFSASYDAVVTKQREAITNLATSELSDIMHKLRHELNTLKEMQARLVRVGLCLWRF